MIFCVYFTLFSSVCIKILQRYCNLAFWSSLFAVDLGYSRLKPECCENGVHWGAAPGETGRCCCIWGFCVTCEHLVLEQLPLIQKMWIPREDKAETGKNINKPNVCNTFRWVDYKSCSWTAWHFSRDGFTWTEQAYFIQIKFNSWRTHTRQDKDGQSYLELWMWCFL